MKFLSTNLMKSIHISSYSIIYLYIYMNIISLLILETTETLHPDATKILELTSLKSGPDFRDPGTPPSRSGKTGSAVRLPEADDRWWMDETWWNDIMLHQFTIVRFQRPQGVVWEDNNNSIWDVHEDFYSCITACWDERSPSIATSHVLIVQLALTGLFFSKRGCDMLQKKPALKGRTSVVPSFSMIGGGVDGIPKSFKVSSFCPNSCHGGVLHGLGCGLTVSPREVPENVSTKYCQYKIYLELQTTILM